MPSRRFRHPAYVFLIALIAPGSDVVFGGIAHRGLALVALIAFAISVVIVLELRPRSAAPPPPRARRWISRGAALLQLVLAMITTLAFGRGWWVLFIFVVATSIFMLPIQRAPRTIVAVAALAACSHLRAGLTPAAIASAVSAALSITMVGYTVLLLRRRSVLIEELRAAQDQVARLAAADAVADERMRIARDLHDLLGHSLSVVVLKAELARRLLEHDAVPAARTEVGELEQLARRALGEVREAVTGYRARTLGHELAQARAALVAAGVDPGPAPDVPALPRDLDDLLAWVVREATTNIVRHSQARRVALDVRISDDLLVLAIRNDGARAEAAPPGSGLVGLRERAAHAGGQLTTTRDGEDFEVRLIVPYTAAAAPPHAEEPAA